MGSQSDYKLIQQKGPSPGQTYPIGRQRAAVIGRDAKSDIPILAAGVSRKHARIYFANQQAFVEDLDSSNGTSVNGQRIEGSKALRQGDQIGLGQSVVLHFDGPPEAIVAQPAAAAKPPVAARPPIAATEAYDVIEDASPAGPPQLVVDIAGDLPRTYILHQNEITIGRSSSNIIPIPSEIVSRQHARLVKDGISYRVEVLPEASNPILFEGRPLAAPRRLRHGDKLRIGSQDPGSMVTLVFLCLLYTSDAADDLVSV